ncbi:uncharacterized protein LOC111035855, partial [Myzus persicae]|uniref:uncharacterized protein LOC111035855 n=1 Tax=Myzus persicae TaxID=13164 RepID=UPI000B9370CD
MARRRFLNLEKKLIKNATLARSYKAFMDEYRDLGHMELADHDYRGPTYYLPHHAVFKMDSSTTKILVVFDGSAAASSGLSLNDILLRGPKRIFFRTSPDEALQEYKLNTVTYGTKSASYLATRCLHNISPDSHDSSVKFILAQNFYADDLLSGGRSEDECFEIHQRLQLILNQLNEEDMISTLGLLWQPTTDTFHFAVKDCVYDPIGLITPVLIKGKILLQQLWTFKLCWDDAIPNDLQVRWIKFYSSLQLLTQLKIPRRVISGDYIKLELHGFCDASQEAFTPIQHSTIPRLELCGALLVAELISEVEAELKLLNIIIAPSDVYLWTDSTIVISWIRSQNLFQVYVSNRLARILDLTTSNQWFHVPTNHNPADLITRGLDAGSISSSQLWWIGPTWRRKQNIVGFIRSEILQWAKHFGLLKTQAEAFPDEIAALKVSKLVPRHSCLKQLNPFIDTLGLIRVGGRLTNASIADSKKFPIVGSNLSK